MCSARFGYGATCDYICFADAFGSAAIREYSSSGARRARARNSSGVASVIMCWPSLALVQTQDRLAIDRQDVEPRKCYSRFVGNPYLRIISGLPVI